MWLGSNSAAAGQSRNLRSASRHALTYQRRRVTVVIDSQLELMSANWPPCVVVATTTTRESMLPEVVKTLVPCTRSFLVAWNRNSLFYGVAEGLTSLLQSVQNAAALLVSGARRYDHIMPVLQELQLSALASGSTSGGFEDGHPSLPVTVQPI